MATLDAPLSSAPNQGVMERRDPLPAGRYWVYIDQSEVDRWQAWVTASAGKVKVVATEQQKAMARWVPAVFLTRWDLSIIQSVVGEWILFDVLEPTKWVGFGYPTTVIDPKVRSATDIATAPAPAPDTNPFGDALVGLLGDARFILLGGFTLYVGLQLWQHAGKGRRS